MRCRKCGKEIEDGLKICSYCGTPAGVPARAGADAVRPRSAERPAPARKRPAERPAPTRQSAMAPRQGKGKKRNLTFTALASVLMMFSAISLLCSGVSVSVGNVKMSLPVMSVSPLIGFVTPDGKVKFLLGVYIALTVIAIILLTASIFMIITRNRSGVLAGIVANAIAALLGIIIIIAIFIIHDKEGSTAFTLMPSVWMWLSVPINIVSGIFMLIEKDDII